MARKEDATKDKPSTIILEQLSTKTVGPPPTATGLTGDQLPNTIFNVDDFDKIRNQINLELTNLEVLNVLNTVGQITATQSVSGPIPKTSQIVSVTGSDSNVNKTLFTGIAGQVWELMVADYHPNNSGCRCQLVITDEPSGGSGEVEIGDETGHGGRESFEPAGNFGPVRVDENASLVAQMTGLAAGRSITVNAMLIRIR